MKSLTRILIQDYNAIEASNKLAFQPAWDLQRVLKKEYQTEKEGIHAADEAFEIFNMPEELLTPFYKDVLKDYKGPSLSVGDVVEVHPLSPHQNQKAKAFLCDSIGWKEKDIPNIKSTTKASPTEESSKNKTSQKPKDKDYPNLI